MSAASVSARNDVTVLIEFNPRCLVDLQQQDPRSFLTTLLTFYPRVRVTSAFEDDEWFETADAVMAHWEKRNREITAQKLLPDGMLHFDLIARTEQMPT